MGRFVIVAYRPRPGRAQELLDLVRGHHSVLTTHGLVSPRPPYLMRDAEGTLVEVFEWSGPNAIEAAHSNPDVLTMWERLAEVCDYVPLDSLAEAEQMFAEFDAVE